MIKYCKRKKLINNSTEDKLEYMMLGEIFMENPFLMKAKADIAIVSGELGEEECELIEKEGIRVIKTIKCDDILEPVSYHPDMVIHPVNHNTIVVAPNVFDYYYENLKNTPIKVVKGETILSRNYPDDIAYNVARVWKYAIHRTKYMDKKLRNMLEKENVQFVDVKQGYSKCSTGIISEKAVVTSDKSIKEKLVKEGIDVCYVKQGYIDLPGFDYGFIGGSIFSLGMNDVFFSGQIEQYNDKESVLNFIKKYGKESRFLSSKKIIDIGSVITLRYN